MSNDLLSGKLSKQNLPLRLVMLGVGQVALQVAAQASQYDLLGTTRNKDKANNLRLANIKPLLIEPEFPLSQQNELTDYLGGAKVLVTFPPDGESDLVFSRLCGECAGIIYISSTSVYGNHTGYVDESTPVDWQSERSKLRLEAEQIWLNKGAIVLRAPGLYGPNSGLHKRLGNGSYRLPIENNNYISRIHLQDLAKIILAVFTKPLESGSVYLVGDLEPATQLEVVNWLCQKMNLPLPPAQASEKVPVTLTSNRRVNAKKILGDLNLDLEFPTYKEGYMQCLQAEGI